MAHPSVPRFTLLVLCGLLGACASTTTDIPSAASAPIRAPGAAAQLAVVGTAWDNFNHRGNIWACRDLASGAIVSTSMCHALAKNDRHWPGMAAPADFRGMPDP